MTAARGCMSGLLAAALLALAAGAVPAQDPVKPPAEKKDETKEQKKDAVKEKPRITGVVPPTVSLRGEVTVRVEHLPKDRPVGAWRLYLNGVPLKGLAPENQDAEQSGELRFRLDRTPETRDAWTKLLRNHQFDMPVRVGLGTDDGVDARVDPFPKAELVVVPRYRITALAVGLLALLGVIVYLAWRTTLLRTRAIDPPPGQFPPYSLGLTQMAFWTFLIVAGYLYIGVITWNLTESIPPSLLVLLGISVGTAFAAVEIDADKRSRREALTAELAQLNAALPNLQAQVATAATANQPVPPAVQAEFDQSRRRTAEIAAALPTLPAPTAAPRRFFYDLISDADGVSLHRLQLVIWTLVLGAVFVSEVYEKLAMPEFNATLLALMGISGGSYIGFKFPEKKA